MEWQCGAERDFHMTRSDHNHLAPAWHAWTTHPGDSHAENTPWKQTNKTKVLFSSLEIRVGMLFENVDRIFLDFTISICCVEKACPTYRGASCRAAWETFDK